MLQEKPRPTRRQGRLSRDRARALTINYAPERKSAGAEILPLVSNDGPSFRSLVDAALADSSYDFLQESVDALMIEIAIVDASGRILSASSAWRSRAEKLALENGQNPPRDTGSLDILSNDDRTAHRIAKCVARVLSGATDLARLNFTTTHGNTYHHFRLRVARYRMGATWGAMIVNEDITELHDLHRDKQRLYKQLMRVEEHERRRIAREMHDSTVQDLVAIGLNLKRLRHLAEDPACREVLGEVHTILARAQQDMRTMSYLLHPPLLDKAGLVPALTELIRGVSKRMEIRIDFFHEAPAVRLPVEAEMALYRIAQEGLINVHKHSSATYAAVRFYCEADQLVLQVEDNGVGIDRRHHNRVDAGVGIPGMRARLRQLGGALKLSRPIQGTILKALIPLGGAARASAC